MYISNKEFFDEIASLKSELKQLRKIIEFKALGKELSLNTCSEILGHDPKTIIKDLILTGKLKARKINHKKSKSGFTYRILDRELIRFLRASHRHQNEPINSDTSIDYNYIIHKFNEDRRAS